jgi:hypothetical protein
MITEPIITINFCEAMYCHFAEQLQLHLDDPTHKEFIEEQQQVYIHMHSLLHNIHLYLEQLGF